MNFCKRLNILNIYIIIYFCFIQVITTQKYQFCVNTNGIKDICDQLKLQKIVTCVHTDDSVNKALKLSTQECQIAHFTAEELLLVNETLKGKIVILSEIRSLQRKNDMFDFETVIVMRKNNTSFINYNGKKMCHSSFKSDRWTPRQLTEFDRQLISQYFEPKQIYNESLSTTENFFAALSSFLGPSCYPGPWSENTTYDLDLKSKYKNLIDLCPETEDENYNPLNCLTEKNGDLAYFDLHFTKKYFNSHSKTINITDYQLVCPDDTFQNINDDRKCSWIRQPWPALVGLLDKQFFIQEEVDTWQKDPNKWKTLRKALNITDENYIFSYNTPKEITQYIEFAKKAPSLNYSDDMQIKWCVTEKYEYEKCGWLSQASNSIGILPQLKCIIKTNVLECVHDVHDKKSDLINIETNFGYIAEHLNELEPVSFEKSKEKSSILLIKNKKSKIDSLKKLNEANICFPEYNGLAWITLQNEIIVVDETSVPMYKEVCAPGANSESRGGSNNTELCKLCLDNQCSILDNPYFGDNGALDCLVKADFAVITKENVNNTVGDFDIMCKNNSVIHKTDLKVDENCALLVTYKKHFVTRKNEAKTIDIEQYLSSIQKYFGKNSMLFNTINLTGHFQGHKNVLFEDSTEDILFPDRFDQYVTNYFSLFEHNIPGDNSLGGLSYGYYILIIVTVFIIIAILIFVVYFVTIKKGYKRANFAP